ncbi:MAG: rRNA maturation RNase YbeY [Planctomycetaceae bacterium]
MSVANQQRHVRFPAPLVRKVVGAALRHCKVRQAEISVALVDDAAIWDLNRRFLGHDYPTDVISFRLDEAPDSLPAGKPPASRATATNQPAISPRGAASAQPVETIILTGEIVASGEMAVGRASEFGWSPDRELALYLVHGVLHLCGYDDHTASQRRAMRRAETDVLRSLGWTVPPGAGT